MYLRPLRPAAAAALLALAGWAAPPTEPAVRGTPPALAVSTQSSDLAFARRLDRFLRFASLPGQARPMLEHLDLQPGQLDSITRPYAVVHVVFSERAFFVGAGDLPRPESSALLDLLAENMKQDVPNVRLTLLSHTDASGSTTYNDELSLRRARNVFQALIDRGVNRGELTAVVIGGRQPFTANGTPSGKMLNRRLEILISGNLDANLAVIRLRPINRRLIATAPAATRSVAQIMAPEFAGTGHNNPGVPGAAQRDDLVMRRTGGIDLQPASDRPGSSPIPRKPILREDDSSWPDPAGD